MFVSTWIRCTNYEVKRAIYNDFLSGGTTESNVILWTDSTIVTAWINCITPLKPYVANRVAQILDVTQPAQWRHVPKRVNPVDLITR